MVWSVIIFIFICVGIILDKYLSSSSRSTETFVNANGTTVEEQIMDIYHQVLQRQPSATEMLDASRKLTNGTWTESGLKQRLLDSDEYQRFVKLQSNQLAPELDKMVADRALFQRIRVLYAEEQKKPLPEDMVLPLKDVYVALDYNEYAFRAFLRSKSYTYFESDTQNGQQMDKKDLVKLIDKHMGGIEKINEQGKVIEEQKAKEAQLNTASSPTSSGSAASNMSNAGGVVGANTSDKVQRTVNDRDSDMTPMVDDIMKRSNKVFNKDELAKMLETQYNETYNIPVQQHYGDMVLRPEMSWSVPQRPPPVCTTLGQKPLTQPVMTNSKLLLGTPLNESEQEVGSIMPSFQYKEYVNVNVKSDKSA